MKLRNIVVDGTNYTWVVGKTFIMIKGNGLKIVEEKPAPQIRWAVLTFFRPDKPDATVYYSYDKARAAFEQQNKLYSNVEMVELEGKVTPVTPSYIRSRIMDETATKKLNK